MNNRASTRGSSLKSFPTFPLENPPEVEHLFGQATQDPALRQLAFDLTILVKTRGFDEGTKKGGCIDKPLDLRQQGYPGESVLEVLRAAPEVTNLLPENSRGQVTSKEEDGTITVLGARFCEGEILLNQRSTELVIVATGNYTFQAPGSSTWPQTVITLSPDSPQVGIGDTLVTTKALRYAIVHQIAHYGNSQALRQLADLPDVDLGLLDAHGRSVLEVAKHRVDRRFLHDARQLMEEKLQAMRLDDWRRPSLVAALQGHTAVLHRGTLSNVMHVANTLPAPVTRSADFMCRCRATARLSAQKQQEALTKGIKPDWLFAREELEHDPVLQKVKRYFECALPVHRTRHEALGNMLAGGALIGKKRLADFVSRLRSGSPQQRDRPIQDMVAKAIFDLSDEMFWSLTAQDVPPDMRHVMSSFLTLSLRLALHDKSDGANLPAGISVKGSIDVEKEREKLEELREELLQMSAQWEKAKTIDTIAKKLGGPKDQDRQDLISSLEDEVDVLCDGLLTFIKLSELGHEGVGFGVDSQFGTDMSLFATLGPNGNDAYGGVALAFKSDILAHPDTDMLPMAATLYRSKTALCIRRPWVVTGMQEVPEQDLPTRETAGFRFSPPQHTGPKKSVSLLAGDASLSALQGMYAWKMNTLNAGFSPDWAEVLAREHVATARWFLSGMRQHYAGQGHFRVAGDPYKKSAAADKKWRVIKKEWMNPGPITADSVIDYYESCDGHAKVECHLPGVLHMQMVEHIWMTQIAVEHLVNHTNMTQSSKVGERMASDEGIVLPDGRVLRVVRAGDRWQAAQESSGLLTICTDNQDIFERQVDFMRRRLANCVVERPITSFRTESGLRMLKKGVRWLPCLADQGAWGPGVAVSWMSNAGDGLEVAFAPTAFEGMGGDMYAINIGKTITGQYWNGMTQVLKNVGSASVKVAVDARTSPKSMCATSGSGGGGCWQRYWAGVSYGNGGAWVLFGRLHKDEEFPSSLSVRSADGVRLQVNPRGTECKVYQPEGGTEPLCLLPVLYDPSPIRSVRFVGFTCLSAPKLISHLQVHTAPAVTVV